MPVVIFRCHFGFSEVMFGIIFSLQMQSQCHFGVLSCHVWASFEGHQANENERHVEQILDFGYWMLMLGIRNFLVCKTTFIFEVLSGQVCCHLGVAKQNENKAHVKQNCHFEDFWCSFLDHFLFANDQ